VLKADYNRLQARNNELYRHLEAMADFIPEPNVFTKAQGGFVICHQFMPYEPPHTHVMIMAHGGIRNMAIEIEKEHWELMKTSPQMLKQLATQFSKEATNAFIEKFTTELNKK
jgi:hypothetical protein